MSRIIEFQESKSEGRYLPILYEFLIRAKHANMFKQGFGIGPDQFQ